MFKESLEDFVMKFREINRGIKFKLISGGIPGKFTAFQEEFLKKKSKGVLWRNPWKVRKWTLWEMPGEISRKICKGCSGEIAGGLALHWGLFKF